MQFRGASRSSGLRSTRHGRTVAEMNSATRIASLILLAGLAVPGHLDAQDAVVLPGTQPLLWTNDLSARMVEGVDRFLMTELERSVTNRSKYWQRDGASPAAYEQSVAPNREHLRQAIGAVDPRVPVKEIEWVGSQGRPSLLADSERYTVHAVRWPVFPGVYGEGLLLRPRTTPRAWVIVVPDANQTPEMLVGLEPGLEPQRQFARHLADASCVVLVPVLVDRHQDGSGNARLKRFTNQPHREWIYRQAFEMGRHIIGYEVQKVLAAVDCFKDGFAGVRVGAAGYAEGGLIALYAAALDTRLDAALVSGYFDSRQRVWEEPIYRNVFGLLREFGDAEIASLVAPRRVIVEHSDAPTIDGPPLARDGRSGAAPGQWQTPLFHRVEAEFQRAVGLLPETLRSSLVFVRGNEGMTTGPGSVQAVYEFLEALGVRMDTKEHPAPRTVRTITMQERDSRQRRQVEELVAHTQSLLHWSEDVRRTNFWDQLKASGPAEWAAAVVPHKQRLWEEVIGRLPPASLPVNPRSRRILATEKWDGYEVVLDVWPEVFAWGCLLLPKDLKPGERRPVVVCQHGLEGLPTDTINGPGQPGYGAYKSFAARLAERGFITFAPHNPYRGGDRFRVLQRKANPLGLSLFSVIVAQHDRILDWLSAQSFVDPKRIGFYGLSYGGKTAMRVPALLDRYCLSICSADFNEWIRKNVTIDTTYSYLFTGEYEMPEFNLGHTFNYAEMAALIAPRPFMVERGHGDGVAPDEWVAYEFAKVRRLYDRLGIGDRAAIEFFNGPHTINGVGTFEFLHRHLAWPDPNQTADP